MIIKKRPIVTWLLNPSDSKAAYNIVLANVSTLINRDLLFSYLEHLNNVRIQRPNWGLPELVMPSFEKVMEKSSESFNASSG